MNTNKIAALNNGIRCISNHKRIQLYFNKVEILGCMQKRGIF